MKVKDLDQAIGLVRDAARAIPEGHPDQPGRLSNLGIALHARFERTGERTARHYAGALGCLLLLYFACGYRWITIFDGDRVPQSNEYQLRHTRLAIGVVGSCLDTGLGCSSAPDALIELGLR